MNKLKVLLFISLLILPSMANAGGLSKHYKLTIGELLELQCSIRDDLSSFTTEGLFGSSYKVSVRYQKKTEKLLISFYGEKESIDNAKTILSYINDQVIPRITDFTMERYDVELKIGDFKSQYVNKETGQEILIMEKGEFIFPKKD